MRYSSHVAVIFLLFAAVTCWQATGDPRAYQLPTTPISSLVDLSLSAWQDCEMLRESHNAMNEQCYFYTLGKLCAIEHHCITIARHAVIHADTLAYLKAVMHRLQKQYCSLHMEPAYQEMLQDMLANIITACDSIMTRREHPFLSPP